jgi:hypothetical protein
MESRSGASKARTIYMLSENQACWRIPLMCMVVFDAQLPLTRLLLFLKHLFIMPVRSTEISAGRFSLKKNTEKGL